MKSKTKILFIHHAKGIGGAATSLIQLVKELNTEKFETQILFIYRTEMMFKLCEEYNISYKILESFFFKYIYLYWTHSDAKTKAEINSIKSILLFLFNKIRKILSYPLLSFYLGPRILKKENPDIIHLNSLFLTDWLIASRISKKKAVVHVREPLSNGKLGLRKSYFRFILKKFAYHIFAISKDNFERVGLPEKSTLVYNSFDLTSVNELKHEYSNNNGILTCIYLGGSMKKKGIDLILELNNKLNKDIKILMLGHYNDNDKEEISKSENFIYIGPTLKPYDFIAKSDVLLFPSLTPHFPKPVTEAFLFKKAVIASDVNGINEIVKDGVNGLIFRTGDSNELSKAIMYLFNNREKCCEFGTKGHDLIRKEFDVKKNIKIVEEKYLDLSLQ